MKILYSPTQGWNWSAMPKRHFKQLNDEQMKTLGECRSSKTAFEVEIYAGRVADIRRAEIEDLKSAELANHNYKRR
jgi:hypothetical protein